MGFYCEKIKDIKYLFKELYKVGEYMDNQIMCNKFINRYIFRGRKFVDYACFGYGYYDAKISGEIGSSFIDDFQYFVFAKSIKSLESIRELLKMGHAEDVFIILRSSFEGYIASRFILENDDDNKLRDLIVVPQLLKQRKIIYDDGTYKNRDTQELIDYLQKQPSDMKLGKDKNYFYDFYAFLCDYAHCNYFIISEYVDKPGFYSLNKADNMYTAQILTLFVYIKIFESIVTVEGEEFPTLREEKECYNLVRESTKFVYDRLYEFSKFNCSTANDELNRHMQKMFKNMRKSLKEEIGSVKKDFLKT